MIMAAFVELVTVVSKREAARLLGMSRASYYRLRKPPVFGPPTPRPARSEERRVGKECA